MKVTHYSYGRTNTSMYSKHCRYDTFTAVLEAELNGKRLCCRVEDTVGVPEHYLRRQLQHEMLSQIGKELFGE